MSTGSLLVVRLAVSVMNRLLLDLALGVLVLELGVVALVIVLAILVHLPAVVVGVITIASIRATATLGQTWLTKTRD